MFETYNQELETALQAVHRASIVTKNVMNGIESVEKSDQSPVTMADFAAQALIISAIHAQFPEDRFVAEESADILKEDKPLLSKVWDLVENANSAVGQYSNKLTKPDTPEEMMDIIDLGSKDTPTSGRVWILDPVDGTATFLRGQQYAVCLSLTIDGKQKVGVLGCPNIAYDERKVDEDLTDKHGYGIILSAVLGHGVQVAPILKDGLGSRLPVTRAPGSGKTADLQFTDSVKSSHAHLPSHQKVFERLGLTKKHQNIWSMQIKYAAFALGSCDAMVRIPPNRSTRAYVWDHAGGQLILSESGGKITDLDGQEFDFAKGRHFGNNWGFVASSKETFDDVFSTVQAVLKERQ